MGTAGFVLIDEMVFMLNNFLTVDKKDQILNILLCGHLEMDISHKMEL